MDPRYSSRYRPRSPTFNPARASMPTSIGYSSMYGGDIHVLPTSTRYTTATAPRAHYSSHPPPPITTTTYAVTKDPLTRGSSLREASRNRRSSTLDSTATRPVIVTTTQRSPHTGGSSHNSSNARSGSPVRDDYRASEGQFFTQPASSIRSRSHQRGGSYSSTLDNDDFSRLRERTGDGLLSPRNDSYRASRPSVIYSSSTRHNSIPVDYAGEYEYTNPSDLARYDLDHTRPPSRSRRRESFDRGYYRPTVNVSTELPRTYTTPNGRSFESRGGPPPTTRGLDKIQQRSSAAGIYDAPQIQMPIPPAVPPAPPSLPVPSSPKDRRSSGAPSSLDVSAGSVADPRTGRRRPVSVYQEGAPRSSHHDEYYRSREDERNQRQAKDLDREYFHDDVQGRGFGIRTDTAPAPDYDARREARRESRRDSADPKKSSDEELRRISSRDDDADRKKMRETSRREDKEKDPRERRASSNDDDGERKRFRDKVSAGLGIAATAIGLGQAVKDKDEKAEKTEKEPKRRSAEEERKKEEEEAAARTADRYKPRETEDLKDRAERQPVIIETRKAPAEPKEDVDARDRNRRDAESKLMGESPRDGSPDNDEGKPRPRRRRPSTAFNPTNPDDLRDIKEQLAAMNLSEKPREKPKPAVFEPPKDAEESRTPSPKKEPALSGSESTLVASKEDSRGRDLVVPEKEEKQVRVVSPPRDKSDAKPLKGILKQPKPQFPEVANPIREGVAPHKDDKKLKDAPPGARWTKISRKIVNPEALTIGKERFEVRDDFVIVLRVLSKEEIQAYAAATQTLRERRREGAARDRDRDRDYDRGRDRADRDRERDDDDRRRVHRYHRRDDDEDDRYDEERDRERDRDRQRGDDDRRRAHRQHRRDDEEDDRYEEDRERERERSERHRRRRREEEEEEEEQLRRRDEHQPHHHHHHHRDRDREMLAIES